MDFQNVDSINWFINMVSGNLFPMTADDSRLSIGWKIYVTVVWLMIMTAIFPFSYGFIMVPKEKIIRDGMIGLVFVIEALFMIARIYARRSLVVQFIQKINGILHVQDETMRCVVIETLKLLNSPIRFYWMSSIITTTLWLVMPIILYFKRTFFFYEDYRLPYAISSQPFSIKIFLLGNLLLIIGSAFILLKKAATDMYMIHLVLLMTAQYRYIALKLEKMFREVKSQDEHDDFHEAYHLRIDSWAEREMKAICRHYNIIVQLSFILKKLLSVNFSLIFVISVLRFSFVGVMLNSAVISMNIVERISVAVFASGETIQFYILCYVVQQLLDASTKMTDMAFHGNWYQFEPSVKRQFMLLILSNNLGCKLAAINKFDLSLSSFMTVMHQAYSIALLCLKIVKK